MKKKKSLIIILFIVFVILISLVFFFIWKEFLNEENNKNPSEITVDVNKADVSIFEITNDNNNFEVTEDSDNIGNVNITIDGETISDQLGDNCILKQSYFKLNDNYYLLEILISRNNETDILSDSDLSLSYENCKKYAKIWYIYNSSTKEKYIFEDNTKSAQLSLNPKITEDELGEYFEFDKMFYFAGRTDVDHYKIDINTLISFAESNEIINFDEFSTINCANFSSENILYSIDTNKDIDGDGKEETINLTIYDDFNDLNKVGFSLRVDDSKIEMKNVSTNPSINFIDIDKSDKFKEILIISSDENEPSVQYLRIFYYDGNNIKSVYNGYIEGDVFSIEKEVNDLDFSMDENKRLNLKCFVSDTVQSWNINKEYSLNDNHSLYEIVPKYYSNLDDQTITSNSNIVLYDEMNLDAKSSKVFNIGEEAKLIGTTLDYWMVISINDNIYYIPLASDGTIKDLELYPSQVFFGLNATD